MALFGQTKLGRGISGRYGISGISGRREICGREGYLRRCP
jgi:hypothetical protein